MWTRKTVDGGRETRWRRGSALVTLYWSPTKRVFSGDRKKDCPSLTVYWTTPAGFHRKDGPAVLYAEKSITGEEALRLSRVRSPGRLDQWFRDHPAVFYWYVCNVLVHEAARLQVPVIDGSFIRARIEKNPQNMGSWFRVARSLGLMDSDLRRLEKTAGLLAL